MFGIVANVAAADSCLRLGARVVVLSIPGNPDHLLVRGISRGGRVVTKYTAWRRLKNYRVAWVYDHPYGFATREEAECVIAARLTP